MWPYLRFTENSLNRVRYRCNSALLGFPRLAFRSQMSIDSYQASSIFMISKSAPAHSESILMQHLASRSISQEYQHRMGPLRLSTAH